MVIASGFIETNDLNDVENVIAELKIRNIEVNEVNNAKIVFLIERETIAQIKNDFEPLKDLNGVRNVHLAYYSVEGADEENAIP